MKIGHIVWDWNGTVLDDAQACVDALNIILGKRGLPAVDIDQYREVFGFPVQKYYIKLGIDFDSEDWDEMAKEFHTNYGETSKDRPLREGVVQVMEEIRKTGIKMSVLSASEISFLEGTLSSWRIRDYFDSVYGLNDIYAHSKIEAGQKMISDLDMDGDQILFIGDTIHDYEVASELKCRCVLLAGGHQAEHRLRQCDCEVYSDLQLLRKDVLSQLATAQC